MTEATYQCSDCRHEHTLRFKTGYRPLTHWGLTCPGCRQHRPHRLVGLVVEGVKKRLTSWGPLTRVKA